MTNNDYVLRQIVLGAGASSGYPLGSDLLRIIDDICQIASPIKIENSNEEFIKNPDEFLSMAWVFAKNLKKSCATSIDFYTTRIADKKMQIVAKSLIGAILNQYKTDLSSSWYGNLLPLFFPADVSFKRPEEKLEMIIELAKEVRIVTFNYDIYKSFNDFVLSTSQIYGLTNLHFG
ncbi:MAG: hypothetical protein EBT63_04745 [Proteobacteria bacterium]|nr:hypothetical protein [Pseudomonadota bacterium]